MFSNSEVREDLGSAWLHVAEAEGRGGRGSRGSWRGHRKITPLHADLVLKIAARCPGSFCVMAQCVQRRVVYHWSVVWRMGERGETRQLGRTSECRCMPDVSLACVLASHLYSQARTHHVNFRQLLRVA